VPSRAAGEGASGDEDVELFDVCEAAEAGKSELDVRADEDLASRYAHDGPLEVAHGRICRGQTMLHGDATGPHDGEVEAELSEHRGGPGSDCGETSASQEAAEHQDLGVGSLPECGRHRNRWRHDGDRLRVRCQRRCDGERRRAFVDEQGLRGTHQLHCCGCDALLFRRVVLHPELERRLEPVVLDRIGPPVRSAHESVVLQHLQVAAHRLDGHAEAARQLADGDTAISTRVRQDASATFDALHLLEVCHEGSGGRVRRDGNRRR
jgi:hypothetical protein